MEAVLCDSAPSLSPCLPATTVLGRATVCDHQALRRGPTPGKPNSGRLRAVMTWESKQRWLICREQSWALSGVTHRMLEEVSSDSEWLTGPGASETEPRWPLCSWGLQSWGQRKRLVLRCSCWASLSRSLRVGGSGRCILVLSLVPQDLDPLGSHPCKEGSFPRPSAGVQRAVDGPCLPGCPCSPGLCEVGRAGWHGISSGLGQPVSSPWAFHAVQPCLCQVIGHCWFLSHPACVLLVWGSSVKSFVNPC